MSDLTDSCTVKYTYSQLHVRLLISFLVAFPSSLVYSLFNRVQCFNKVRKCISSFHRMYISSLYAFTRFLAPEDVPYVFTFDNTGEYHSVMPIKSRIPQLV